MNKLDPLSCNLIAAKHGATQEHVPRIYQLLFALGKVQRRFDLQGNESGVGLKRLIGWISRCCGVAHHKPEKQLTARRNRCDLRRHRTSENVDDRLDSVPKFKKCCGIRSLDVRNQRFNRCNRCRHPIVRLELEDEYEH